VTHDRGSRVAFQLTAASPDDCSGPVAVTGALTPGREALAVGSAAGLDAGRAARGAREDRAMKRRRLAGFTLVELMIVVAILGILAAVAIPAYQRYLVKTKASEAPPLLRRMMDGATAYFYTDHVTSSGVIVEQQFPPTTAWYPLETPQGHQVIPAATDPQPADVATWAQLRFTLTDGVYFHYRFQSSGVGSAAQADARAEGYLLPGHLCSYMRSTWTKGSSSLELEYSDLKVISPAY
jgi:prepilin-type N-terminal cleavage/methylation domain-containing protein